jgi:hypothetical protein
MKKILIIGGGWIGCHLYLKLRDKYDVTMFEKNDFLLSESSFYNQNRLHIGFHYPRNYETRELCKLTFDRFKDDYLDFLKPVDKNIYCVPKNESIIDYKTYIDIFRDFDFDFFECSEVKNIEGSIKVGEMYIDNIKVKNYFNDEINFIKKEVDINNIGLLCNEYDFVINCTNNQICKQNSDSFYELTISLVYKKIKETTFDSITLVDGNLFSLYPYQQDLWTLTDVEFTPIEKFKSIEDLNEYKHNLADDEINKRIKLFESKVEYFFPNFKEHFTYVDYFTSIKSKIFSKSDSRYPIINKDKNLISCFTGKIQGIYIIEDYIKKTLNYE